MYEYKCLTIRVIDGSTIDAEIDLGFNILVRQRIKLFGVNPPDLKSYSSDEKERAARCKNRLIELIGKEFYCNTILNKRGKAGRTLGYVHVLDENGNKIDVNKKLVEEGLASHYGD
jgi:micrococcal nuclease